MGNIATITVNHDFLASIEKDKEFGAKLAQAIRRQHVGPEEIDHYAYVVEWHHNSFDVMVKVGGHVGEAIPHLLPSEMHSTRLTKKRLLERLELLTARIGTMFGTGDYSIHLVQRAIKKLSEKG